MNDNDDGRALMRAALNGTVDGDEVDAPLVFAAVARQLPISAQIIFLQRKVGVGLGKGARACGKSYHFDTPEKKRHIDFWAWVGYYVV